MYCTHTQSVYQVYAHGQGDSVRIEEEEEEEKRVGTNLTVLFPSLIFLCGHSLVIAWSCFLEKKE